MLLNTNLTNIKEEKTRVGVKYARRDTFPRKEIFARRHFCMALIFHKNTFARVKIFLKLFKKIINLKTLFILLLLSLLPLTLVGNFFFIFGFLNLFIIIILFSSFC